MFLQKKSIFERKNHEHTWTHMNTHEHPWTPMNTHEHPWTPMNTHEHPWTPMNTHEHTWTHMNTHEHTWTHMNIHEHTWNHLKYQIKNPKKTCKTKHSKQKNTSIYFDNVFWKKIKHHHSKQICYKKLFWFQNTFKLDKKYQQYTNIQTKQIIYDVFLIQKTKCYFDFLKIKVKFKIH